MRDVLVRPKMIDKTKIEEANDFFNRIRWVSDREHWGQEDYWATPVETLVTNGGDCEDFSIAKYFTLDASGMDNEKLRITYVKRWITIRRTWYGLPSTGGGAADFNNINKRIMASKRKDLLPIYSFNGDGLWLAKSRGKAQG